MKMKIARTKGGFELQHYARALLDHAPSGLVLPILSGPLRGRWWLVRSANYSCWRGTYELVKQRLFVAELHRGTVVFDIGAHVGFYTLLAASIVGTSGKVVAFEPLEFNVAKLRRNIALNHMSADVIECAVADRDGEARFKRGVDSYTGGLHEVGVSVAVVTLDALRAAGTLPDPDVMKIDVEGAEALVLKGASNTIATSRPTIFLATHGFTVRNECLQLLDGYGYLVQPLVGDGLDSETEYVARPLSGRTTNLVQ